jgi:hypothetical protein
MNKKVGANNNSRFIPISKADIEHAQANTKSNAEAARFLGVGYERYKRYAKIYNLFDRHTNQRGIGTAKGYAAKASSIPLKDIFANKHTNYSLIRLKHRMIARNLILEECAMCGFKEKRVTDSKTPLIITFKNGMKDYSRDNIQLMCYNCLFLTTGAPSVASKGYIVKSFEEPENIPKRWDVDPRPADVLDVGETEPDNTNDEFLSMQEEILKELGRG